MRERRDDDDRLPSEKIVCPKPNGIVLVAELEPNCGSSSSPGAGGAVLAVRRLEDMTQSRFKVCLDKIAKTKAMS